MHDDGINVAVMMMMMKWAMIDHEGFLKVMMIRWCIVFHDTNMAAVLLFWDTNMAAVTSCENTLYSPKIAFF